MREQLQFIFRFLRFYWQATTSYRVHSPFVFRFTQEVLDDNRMFYAFPMIENLRRHLLGDTRTLQITDYGAGSKVQKGNHRTVKKIAKYSASSPFYCQILFKTINLYQPKKLLELGTSLGVSTLYQAAALRRFAHFVSIEGCPNIAQLAKENFNEMGANNIDLRIGQFTDQLDTAIQELGTLDYVFIDGDHREASTLAYFEECLAHAHEKSIFVFDDIHWSSDMESAWEKIKAHPRVRLTIDLFHFGLVFFRKENPVKEHYLLVPSRWKPWIMGFFR